MSNIVTLDEVRAHLRYPLANTQDDAALQFHIDAADDAIRKECGEILPQIYDESYDGGRPTIFLNRVPVISVEGIRENWGFASYDLDNIQPDSTGAGSMFAYSIDNDETGEITRRTSGNIAIPFMRGKSNIRITYTAGRLPVPALIRLAELELIAYWWQNSQQRASQQTTASGFGAVDQGEVRSGPEAGIQSINIGIPWRIIEMIKAYRAGPIIG
jgi:hypothetical protein